jgi:hypothetical protein
MRGHDHEVEWGANTFQGRHLHIAVSRDIQLQKETEP